SSANFPVTGTASYSSYRGGPNDTFVLQLNASGGAMTYSSYLGGSGDDVGQAIGLDSATNAYVTGNTTSSDFPTTIYGYPGGTAQFVTKFLQGAPDTTLPAVSITAPAAGTSVTGTVTVNVNATDNVGVTLVQVYVDGVSIGSDSTSPFSVSWTT